MAKCIELGAYNNNYKYILLTILFTLFIESLNSINYYSAFNSLKLFPTNAQEKYPSHKLIHQITNFLGIFIISTISYNINKARISHVEETPLILEEEDNSSSSTGKLNNENPAILKLFFYLTIFVWIIIEQAIEKYNRTFCHLEFWMIELMIISYLCSKKLNIVIYKHQKLVLYFNIIPIIFKIGTIILAFYDTKFILAYTVYPILIPIGFFIYILFMFVKSYVNVSLKYLMDSKYFSANKILRAYGLIGTIFLTIICIISTLFKCKDSDKNNKNIIDDICSIEYNNKKYYENFIKYINTSEYAYEIIIEILAVILGMIFIYFYKFYSLMIIKYLNPIYITLLTPTIYFFDKLISLIYNLILTIFHKAKFLENDGIEYIKENFYLDFCGDIFCFISFLVYLEIIELNCLDLSYNSRKKIDERARIESIALNSEKGDIYKNNINDDNEDEDIDIDEDKY